ncbi:MAG: hypothetical protein WCK56_05470 [Alcaligenaceae bacterium]
MVAFSNISLINPEAMPTWKSKIFLSFDIDWAHDEILNDTIEIVKKAGVASTWFVTHDTPLISELRKLVSVELGIHPNFNPLLDGTCTRTNNTSAKILKNALFLIPEAQAIRSHSLTQNERLVDQFRREGLTHISNYFVPHGCGVDAKPFRIWDQMVIIPHCWQDNVSLKMSIPFPTSAELNSGFHVFDFHPIHVFLNTESLERYERTRQFHQKPSELIKHRYDGVGTRTKLFQLLDIVR